MANDGGTRVVYTSNVPAFREAILSSSVDSIMYVARLVAKDARQRAPRSKQHRVGRVYPGGRKFADAKSIRKSIIVKKTKSKITSFGAIVKAGVGYSVFQEYGWNVTTRRGRKTGRKIEGLAFMHKALADNVDRIIPILRANATAKTEKIQVRRGMIG